MNTSSAHRRAGVLQVDREPTVKTGTATIAARGSLLSVLQYATGWLPRKIATGLMLLPAGVLIAAVYVVPLFTSLALSFFARAQRSELVPTAFIGFENYLELISEPNFLASIWRTLTYTATTVTCEIVVGFAIALALNVNLPLMRIARAILIVPMMMTPVVAALMWKLAFDVSHGFVSKVIPIDVIWLGTPLTAFVSLIFVSVWQHSAYVALILLAGLRSVPSELIDAASLDGATWLQRLRHIVIPVLVPHLVLATLLRTIFEFRSFENVFVMTGGGPGTSTMLLSLFTYNASFSSYELGLSSAAAWVTLILTLVLSGVLFAILRGQRKTHVS